MEETTREFIRIFSERISCVRTAKQKIYVLSDMEECFRQAVRSKPNIRNEISAVYEKLKIQCEHAA